MIDIEVLYSILAESARNRSQIFYADLSQAYFEQTDQWHEPHGSWDEPLGELNTRIDRHDWPPLSAVVVLKSTNEPGGRFWESSPSIPARPADDIARIALYGQLLEEVFAAPWPEQIPTTPRT